MDTKTKEYLTKIKAKYHVSEVYNGTKLQDKIYLSLDNEFTWPSLNSAYLEESGFCYGGKTHLAILSDGTVSICCLDSEAISNLGNIHETSLEEILNSFKYKSTIQGWNDHKTYLDICGHCKYKERFNKNIY